MSRRLSKATGTKITKPQKFKLLEMMKESPELEYGNRGVKCMKTAVTRENAVKRWKEIARVLNLMDHTAQKEWQGWRRSWSDIRAKMPDDWSLVIQAHLNQIKRNRRVSNSKIYTNDDDDHVVTVPKIEPDSDDSSSGTDSDLMTNHDGPKVLPKNNRNPITLKIKNIKAKIDNEDNNNDDNDDSDSDNDNDENDHEVENEEEQEQQSNNFRRTTRSKSNINQSLVETPVISIQTIQTKPHSLRKEINDINGIKKVVNNNSENLLKNANYCTVRIKKIPNNINERVNVQNNNNEKRKNSFTNFMKEYVENKAKVKENYYTRKLQLLQRDVIAKESIASSLRILIERRRDI